MALDSYSYDCCVLPPLDWDWDWDELIHTTPGLGAGGAAVQVQEPAFFFPATPGVDESPASSEASSGYLQDAVAHWSGCCNNDKRQRMAETPPHRHPATGSEDLQCLLESFWDSSAEGGGDGDLPHDLNTTIPETEICCSFVSGEDGAGASCREEEEEQQQQQRGPIAQVLALPAEQRGGEAAAAAAAVVPPPPPPRFPATVRAAAPLPRLQKATAGADHAAARRDDRSPPVDGCCDCEPSSRAGAAATTTAHGSASACPSLLSGEKKRGVGVLYPFAVVKPLGLDDGRMTTLDDVNRRNFKRPARPVRHPVGPFASGPAVTAHGLGLSGKAVVSLTKIRTGGNGTITIIRTRG